MEQISKDDGSGGYQSPCSAAAFLTSAFIKPGCVTATRATGSIVICRIRSVLTTMQPSTALDPPERPEPAPLGTTGTRLAVAHRITVWMSSVHVARTTAAGWPAVGSAAQSWR